jgi:hypothetical protein
MFKLERLSERATRGRWVPVPGPLLGTREEAAKAMRGAVRRELRKGVDGRGRTDRFRIAVAAVACLVLQ